MNSSIGIKPFYSGVLAVIILCCLSFSVYSNTLHSPFQFDDENSIIENSHIRNLADLSAIWNFWPTRFIVYLTVAINYHFNRLDVFGYHLFNIIIHLGTAILAWWFVLLTFSTPAMKGKKIARNAGLIAFFPALLFAVHPIQTEAVTYIIQRAASLATLFYLACLGLYVKSRLLQQEGGSRGIVRLYYYGSLATAVLAMFTKEIAITLPLMILLYETCFLESGKNINWKRLVPFFIALLIIPLVMFLSKSVDFMQMRRSAELGPDISVWNYLLTQPRVIVTYLRLLFMPLNQNLDYDFPVAKNIWELSVAGSFIFLIFILLVAIKMFSRYRLASFGIFWFFLTLLPESSVIPIKDVINEHRLYLPMLGFSIFLTVLVYGLFGYKTLKPAVIILLIIVACYSVLTYRRNSVWKDELGLWNDVVRKSPQKARPYNNRGLIYFKRGEPSQALSDFNRAIEITPDYFAAYFNRGITYQGQGKATEAIFDFTKAIEFNPLFSGAYNNRGNLYRDQGEFDQAMSDYTKAIQIEPTLAQAYNNRGNLYYEEGNLAHALADFNKAIEIDRNYANVYCKRGNIYYKQGNFRQALADFNRAIEIDHNYALAFNNRALVYFSIKDYNKSREDVHKAEVLGYKVSPGFIKELKDVLGTGK